MLPHMRNKPGYTRHVRNSALTLFINSHLIQSLNNWDSATISTAFACSHQHHILLFYSEQVINKPFIAKHR